MTPEILELEGRQFISLDQGILPEWPCVLTERPHPILTLKDDDLFLLTDTLGNVGGCTTDDRSAGMGLFCNDTRFLSRLELQIEGRSPILLSSTADKGFILSVLCTNPTIEDKIKAESIGIRRELVLNGALFEDIEISNYSTTPVSFEISLSFDSDFIDLFEVRGFGRSQRGQRLRQLSQFDQILGYKLDLATGSTNGELPPQDIEEANQTTPPGYPVALVLAYQGLDGLLLESRVQFCHRQPDYLKGNTAIWQFQLDSHETQMIGYCLQPLTNGRSTSIVSSPSTLAQAKAAELMEEQTWRQQATSIQSDKNTFNQIIQRAEQDIYLLRQSFGKSKVLSAGVPWFSTLFGRDSIIAASQVLLLDPQIARETLMTLAYYQGKENDDWRDEQPGKILHEIRFGEMARCQEIPHTPYYGTIDATPLWLMLYAEYFAWTADFETLESLWANALAGMDWVDRMMKPTGYLTYDCKSSRGLVNQGWKDSGDCIVNRRGHLARGPIALCEVQAYVYAAKVRLAQIARMKKRIDLADRWEDEARASSGPSPVCAFGRRFEIARSFGWKERGERCQAK